MLFVPRMNQRMLCLRGLMCVVCPENEPVDVVFEG